MSKSPIYMTPGMHKAIRKHIGASKLPAYREYGVCYIEADRVAQHLKEMNVMPNLFPDMSRENYKGSDDFIYGAPIDEGVWKRLCEMANMTANNTPFITLDKAITNTDFDITLLLRNDDRSDEDMLEAAAWLRVVEGNRSRIYAVPWYKKMDLHTALVKTIGAPRHLSVMFDLPKEKADDSE